MAEDTKEIAETQVNSRQVVALASAILARTQLLARMGKSFETQRDIFNTLGYIVNPTFEDYWWRFKRTSIGSRIMKAYPKACWQKPPQISENQDPDQTSFEEAWTELVKEHGIFRILRRADILAGIGSYGVLYLGFSGEPDQELTGSEQFLYLRPFTSNTAEIAELVTDKSDPRFGKPLYYNINLTGNTEYSGVKNYPATTTIQQKVHYSRVIHIAEELEEDELFHSPRLEAPLNDLQSLDFVVGGSGEMFWRGASPKTAFLAKDDVALPTGTAKTDMEDEIAKVVHNLKNYMKLSGVDIHEFTTQVSSPKDHYQTLISNISAATEIPARILLGSERGELASSQDRDNWGDKVEDRRNNYCEPVLLRPLINLFIDMGILPEPESYTVIWPPIQDPGDKETADVANTVAEALTKFASGQAEFIISKEMYLKKYLQFTPEEIQEASEAVNELEEEMIEEENPSVGEAEDQFV